MLLSNGLRKRRYSWTATTWTRNASGRAINTPGVGSEIISNGAFTSDTTGWTAVNGTLASVAGGQSGNALENTNGSSTQCHAYQGWASTVGTWYQQTFYHKNGNQQGIYRVATTTLGNDVHAGAQLNDTDWTQYAITYRALSTTTYSRFSVSTATTAQTTLWDTVSVKAITLANLFASVSGSVNNATVTAKINATGTGTKAGIVSLLDSTASPANFLIAYRDGAGNILLDKCVGGTYTNLISTASTFVSDALIEIRRPSGNTFQLFYNGSQVGTNQTVSDAGIIDNTLYGLFSTYSGNTFSQFTVGGVEVPFPF